MNIFSKINEIKRMIFWRKKKNRERDPKKKEISKEKT